MPPIHCVDKLIQHYRSQGEHTKAYKATCIKINESAMDHLLMQFELLAKVKKLN